MGGIGWDGDTDGDEDGDGVVQQLGSSRCSHCHAKKFLWRYAVDDIAGCGINIIENREM